MKIAVLQPTFNLSLSLLSIGTIYGGGTQMSYSISKQKDCVTPMIKKEFFDFFAEALNFSQSEAYSGLASTQLASFS
ncbi:MAG: hypothetical protein JJU48_00730 [Methylophaga sp.]|nr:hypothetical protein [Methylophaga sp.]